MQNITGYFVDIEGKIQTVYKNSAGGFSSTSGILIRVTDKTVIELGVDCQGEFEQEQYTLWDSLEDLTAEIQKVALQ